MRTPGPAEVPAPSARFWLRIAVVVLVVGTLLLGAQLLDGGSDTTLESASLDEPAPAATPAAPMPSPADSSEATGEPGPPDVAPAVLPTGIEPVSISIPAIGVDAAVIDLDLRGPAPEVPSDFAEAGWYTQTRLPGEVGPAVIAGHIDSRSGPAVFFRLDQLAPGDEITVAAADGETRTFVVTRSGQYPKTQLPDEVFGFGDPVPELRLITCGGTFDRDSGHYRDNYVVYTQEKAP